MRPVRIFVSSPGDVDFERRRVERVVERLNGEFSEVAHLSAVRWETEYYKAHDTYQKQIPLSETCDIVIGLFWSRLGSELPPNFPLDIDGRPWPSGTAYELLTAIRKRQAGGELPDVYVFRKTADVSVAAGDASARAAALTQMDRLDRFWEEWFQSAEGHFKAAFQSFDTPDDFEAQVEQLLRAWLAEHVLSGRTARWPIRTKGSPFRGLEPFDSRHSSVFFGRDRQIMRGTDLIKVASEMGMPSLFVIGASGTGKSSLVQAGLVPRLQLAGVVPNVDSFRLAILRPAKMGEALRSLCHQLFDADAIPELAQGYYRTPSALQQLLAHADGSCVAPVVGALNEIGLHERRVQGFDRPVRVDLIVVIDQLEEIFAEPAEAQQQFGALLQTLASSGRVWVISTLRADLYARLLECASLKAFKEKSGTLDLGPPGAPELAAIVRAPAAAAALVYDTNSHGVTLDERILQDASPDMLPLLQFTLQRLYEERVIVQPAAVPKGATLKDSVDEFILSHAVYERLGGIDGAVDTEGERAMATLGDAEAAALPKLLRQMTVFGQPNQAVGGANDFTARPVAFSDAATNPTTKRLIDALIAARIVLSESTFAADEASVEKTTSATLRLAHERVLKAWKRAARIMAESREFLRRRSDVESQHSRWLSTMMPDDLLISAGLPLAEAVSLLESRNELEPALADYIDASLRAEETRRQAALARTRRLQRVSASAAAVFACVAAIAGWQYVIASRATIEAVKATAAAEREKHNAVAQTERATIAAKRADDEAAKALAAATRAEKSLRSARISQARFVASATIKSVKTNPEFAKLAVLEVLPDNISDAAVPAVAEAISVLSLTNQSHLKSHALNAQEAVFGSGNLYTILGVPGQIAEVWDDDTLLKIVGVQYFPDNNTIDVNHKNSLAAILSISGDIYIIEYKSGIIKSIINNSYEILSLTFSINGEYIAVATDNNVTVFDVMSGKPKYNLSSFAIKSVHFSYDGISLISATISDNIQIRNIKSGMISRYIKYNDYTSANSIKISPHGDNVAIFTEDKILNIIDVRTGEASHVINCVSPVVSSSFNRDGRLIATASSDNIVRIWDLRTGALLRYYEHAEGAIKSITFGGDTDNLMVNAENGASNIWDMSDIIYPEILIAKERLTPIRKLTEDERKSIFLEDIIDERSNKASTQSKESIDECDALTANPFDPLRAITPGILFQNIETIWALPACKAAVKKQPNVPRFRYQLGRALSSIHREKEAFVEFKTAADEGYNMALNSLAIAYMNGEGVNKDIAVGIALHQKASSRGITSSDFALGQYYWDYKDEINEGKSKAVKLWDRCAAFGNPLCHERLGWVAESERTRSEDNLLDALFHYAVATKLYEEVGLDELAREIRIRRGALARTLAPAKVASLWPSIRDWKSKQIKNDRE